MYDCPWPNVACSTLTISAVAANDERRVNRRGRAFVVQRRADVIIVLGGRNERGVVLDSSAPTAQLFREQFGAYYPAMALFEVVSLFQDEALIELEGFAVIEA